MEKPTLKDYAKAAEIGVSKKNVDQRMGGDGFEFGTCYNDTSRYELGRK